MAERRQLVPTSARAGLSVILAKKLGDFGWITIAEGKGVMLLESGSGRLAALHDVDNGESLWSAHRQIRRGQQPEY